MADGIHFLGSFGQPPIVSLYLVKGDETALVESGPRCIGEQAISAIERVGVAVEDLSWIALTHIHLDHAGGAWHIARRARNAKVAVLGDGARHLENPERLLASSALYLGETLRDWGEVQPLNPEQIARVKDGDRIELGGKVLRVIQTPGHAPHHMSLYEEQTRTLLPGDAVGLYYAEADAVVPASPPPSFNLDLALTSLQKLASLSSKRILLSHFGYHNNPSALLERNIQTYTDWAEILQKESHRNPPFDTLLATLLDHYPQYRILLQDKVAAKMLTVSLRGFYEALRKNG
ncbi:MAG: MBL fold metallo-hydrolase [Candidatus Bathyarchaeia archaeon]